MDSDSTPVETASPSRKQKSLEKKPKGSRPLITRSGIESNVKEKKSTFSDVVKGNLLDTTHEEADEAEENKKEVPQKINLQRGNSELQLIRRQHRNLTDLPGNVSPSRRTLTYIKNSSQFSGNNNGRISFEAVTPKSPDNRLNTSSIKNTRRTQDIDQTPQSRISGGSPSANKTAKKKKTVKKDQQDIKTIKKKKKKTGKHAEDGSESPGKDTEEDDDRIITLRTHNTDTDRSPGKDHSPNENDMTPSTRHKRGTEVHRKKTKKRTFKAQDLIDKPLEVLEHLLQSKEIDQETKLDLFLYGNRKAALQEYINQLESNIEYSIEKQDPCNEQLARFFDPKVTNIHMVFLQSDS